MSLAKTGFDEKEYEILDGEINFLRGQMREVKWKESVQGVRVKWEQESEIGKFDEEIFRRFVEKVRVRSMVEVEFLFKAGLEVREVL